MKKANKERRELRNFGLLVGGIFLLIGLWPAIFKGGEARVGTLALGFALVILGALLPQSLKYIYAAWMKLGHILSWINTRILLGFIFYGLITPMGLVFRLFGRNPMELGRAENLDTYRVTRKTRSKDHMKNQF
jgi:hypothetical protein